MLNFTPTNDYIGEDICFNYRNKSPTAKYLLKHAPPEYFPMLSIAGFFFLFNTILLIFETRKHLRYFKGVYFKLSARVMMMLTVFWLFAVTCFLGMIYVRGDVFLHFIANSFESACLLAFFDCLILHSRAIGEVFDGKTTMVMRTPPCCCCLCCLPKMKNTKRNVKWLRYAIFQLMFVQMLVEFIRVLYVFDCSFDPKSTSVLVLDSLVTVSFLFGMWGLIVLFKANKVKLAKYKYMKKFAGFKLMILVSKLLYKILALLADNGHVPSYPGLGAKERCAIWTNFVTVVVSTLLLFVCRNLYRIDDYKELNEMRLKLYTLEENDMLLDGTDSNGLL